ncbi:MAG: GIY-YIG nuclease family protein [Pseudomonadota bacterium]
MPYWVYVLQSDRTGRYYCGQTNNLDLRLKEHNDSRYQGTKTTKRFEGPWRLIWSGECKDRSEAMALERTIKKRGIGRYLLDKGIIKTVEVERRSRELPD